MVKVSDLRIIYEAVKKEKQYTSKAMITSDRKLATTLWNKAEDERKKANEMLERMQDGDISFSLRIEKTLPLIDFCDFESFVVINKLCRVFVEAENYVDKD
jgi:hypothetical protein